MKLVGKTEDEIVNLMKEGKFFKNDFEEFEILLNWLKESEI